MCKGSTSLNLKLKSVITFVIVSVDDIISSPDIIATKKIAIGTKSIPIVNGSIANFPDLRDHDQVLIAAHITANALITPIAI